MSNPICLKRTCIVIVVCLLAAIIPADANTRVPPEIPDQFALKYEALFDNTIVFAQTGKIAFWYRFAGEDPAQPAPGWVRISTTPYENGVDEIGFGFGDGIEFRCVGVPYFAITVEQARRIAVAPKVTVTFIRDVTGTPKQRVTTSELDQAQRGHLRKLLEHGADWTPPDKLWEISGATAFAVDLRAMRPEQVERTKQIVRREIARREKTKSPFILVTPTESGASRAPSVRGTNHFEPDRPYYDPAEPRKFVDELKPVTSNKAEPVGALAAMTRSQQLQTMVLFVDEGPAITDPDIIEAQLRQESCRLLVVWLGDPTSRSERAEQLRSLAFRTRGAFREPSQ